MTKWPNEEGYGLLIPYTQNSGRVYRMTIRGFGGVCQGEDEQVVLV